MTDKTIAELRKWLRQIDCGEITMSITETFNDGKQRMKDLVLLKIDMLSHAVPVKEVEPLAVLADRKGFALQSWANKAWHIQIGFCEKEIIAPTWGETESKARAYLEGLEDVNGGR